MKKSACFAWLTQHGDARPWGLKFRSSDAFIIATVALAVFTDMFLYAMIVPVIPFALEAKSHTGHDRVQYWVSVLIAIYGAALLAFSPICGWLADRSTSRRSPLLIGLVALLGSTVLLNVGTKIGFLIVGRVLQGTSAAVVWVVGLALMADTVPQDRLAQAMGYVSLCMSSGTLIAPLLGGIVFDRAGYNAVFAMAYALIGIDIILRLLLIEKKIAARWDPEAAARIRATGRLPNPETENELEVQNPQDIDNITNLPSTPHTAADADGDADPEKQQQSMETTPSPAPPTTLTTNTTTATTTTRTRTRRRDTLPPILSLLYSRRLLSALFTSIIQASLLTSFDSVLPLHASKTFSWTSTGAALLFLPLVIPTFLAPISGYISDRIGGRYPAAFGFLLATPPLICLRFVDSNTIKDKVLLCALLALIGLSLSLTFPPIMAEISHVVEAKEKSMLASTGKGFGPGGAYAQAYALFNVAFAAGCMIGPLLAGFIVEERGWQTMAWVLGLLSAGTAVPTVLWLGGWVFGKGVRTEQGREGVGEGGGV